MFKRYLHLAILATTAASALSQSAHESADMARQLAGDFDWDIQAEDGVTSAVFGSAAYNEETVSLLSVVYLPSSSILAVLVIPYR
jgi:hypothetical protein